MVARVLRRRCEIGHQADSFLAYLSAKAAVAHADAVTQKVIAALELLAADVIELTGPALQRLERVVAITDELLKDAEGRERGDRCP